MKLSFLKREIPKRPVVVLIALVALAGVVAGRERPAHELIEATAPRAQSAKSMEPDIDLGKLQRAEAAAPQHDPFARRSFAPRQHAGVARDASAAAPSAPPLPFTYFGKVTENGKTEVFLMRGDDLISIAAGQKIDGEYRVDAISESSIAITYLPLKIKQSIELAKASG